MRCIASADERCSRHVLVEPRERQHMHADVQQRVRDIGDRNVLLLSRQPFWQRNVHGHTEVRTRPRCVAFVQTAPLRAQEGMTKGSLRAID